MVFGLRVMHAQGEPLFPPLRSFQIPSSARNVSKPFCLLTICVTFDQWLSNPIVSQKNYLVFLIGYKACENCGKLATKLQKMKGNRSHSIPEEGKMKERLRKRLLANWYLAKIHFLIFKLSMRHLSFWRLKFLHCII
jgi:hypothetical protein